VKKRKAAPAVTARKKSRPEGVPGRSGVGAGQRFPPKPRPIVELCDTTSSLHITILLLRYHDIL